MIAQAMFVLALLALLIILPIMLVPGVRRFLGRHRVWVALASPVLLPTYALMILGLSLAPEGRAFAAAGLAYAAGVVAFALVTAIQDRSGR